MKGVGVFTLNNEALQTNQEGWEEDEQQDDWGDEAPVADGCEESHEAWWVGCIGLPEVASMRGLQVGCKCFLHLPLPDC